MILDERNRQHLIFLILQFLHEEGYEESLISLEQESEICFRLVLPRLEKRALSSLITLISPNPYGGNLKEDLVWLILQFLHEANYNNTRRKLLQESKVLFDLNHFSKLTTLGEIDKAEEYLEAFTYSDDENKYTKAMFFEIQKLKHSESSSSRGKLLRDSVIMLAKKNPVLKDKLEFPNMEESRLLKLMKKTMDWMMISGSNSLENVPVVPYLLKKNVGSNFKVKEINDSSQCNALILPECFSEEKIARLTYYSSGDYILALAEDGTHKLWTWSSSNQTESFNVFPKQPLSGKTMKNEIAAGAISCFAIKGSYLFSTSGSRISVFDLNSFEKVACFGSPTTPKATYFIFIPDDLLAIGLDDGSILIHCLSSRTVKAKLEGHDHQRITCLAFSSSFDILVSSGADGKVCVWSVKSYVKLTSNNNKSNVIITHLQFDPYQIELLVVHERWICVHDATTLDCLLKWFSDESIIITCATYSSNGEIIYVGLTNGFIKVLDSKTMETVSQINLTAFMQPGLLKVYPSVVAAHPSHLSQISVGLNNGKVIVLQPLGEYEEETDADSSLSSSDH